MKEIIVRHKFSCPWDMFICPDKRTANRIKNILIKEDIGDVSLSRVIPNCVMIETGKTKSELKNIISSNIVDISFAS